MSLFLNLLFVIILTRLHKAYTDSYLILVSTHSGSYTGTGNSITIKLEGDLNTTTLPDISGGFATASTRWITSKGDNVGRICGITVKINGYDGWTVNKVLVLNRNTKFGREFVLNRELDNHAQATIRFRMDAEFGEFGSWSNCSAKCGENGTVFRTRMCDEGKRACGGRTCEGENTVTKMCLGPRCPTTSTTTTTISSKSGTIPFSTKSHSTSDDTECKSKNSIVISLIVVLTLSIVLSAILTVFLYIVLRDRRNDRKNSPITMKTNTDADIYANVYKPV